MHSRLNCLQFFNEVMEKLGVHKFQRSLVQGMASSSLDHYWGYNFNCNLIADWLAYKLMALYSCFAPLEQPHASIQKRGPRMESSFVNINYQLLFDTVLVLVAFK